MSPAKPGDGHNRSETVADPVLLFCGIIARGAQRLARAEDCLAGAIGPIDARSDVFDFDSTDYYAEEMGPGLLRRFVSFRDPVDPGSLADIKLQTNRIERQLAETSPSGELRRSVNLDPGYIAPSKLVLATTKDFSHRVYLREGIYAEVTLNFGKEGLRYFPWTYPDFKSGRYDDFLLGVRRRACR